MPILTSAMFHDRWLKGAGCLQHIWTTDNTDHPTVALGGKSKKVMQQNGSCHCPKKAGAKTPQRLHKDYLQQSKPTKPRYCIAGFRHANLSILTFFLCRYNPIVVRALQLRSV